MTTTEITADQISPGGTISATFAGVLYRGLVTAIEPAVFSTAIYKTPHLTLTFKHGGYWKGQSQSISIPAGQLVKRL